VKSIRTSPQRAAYRRALLALARRVLADRLSAGDIFWLNIDPGRAARLSAGDRRILAADLRAAAGRIQ
jgi:hypothetical protein